MLFVLYRSLANWRMGIVMNLDKDHLIYLAGPYSGDEVYRFHLHEKCCAKLMKRGLNVYSPIVHCHQISLSYGLPSDTAWWKQSNEAFLSRCTYLYVMKIKGWDTSKGTKHEINYALEHNIPITYIEEDDV